MHNFSKYVKLIRGLRQGDFAYTGPFFINVNTTRLCNQKCRGCQYHSSDIRKEGHHKNSPDHISMDIVEAIASDLPELETKEVFLSGQGEPMLHPHLDKMITEFKRGSCRVQVFTNGILLDEKSASMLISSGLDVLRVSLWAINTEEYQRCYPGMNPDNLTKTLEGIKSLSQLRNGRKNPSIILTSPLNRHNWQSMEERVRLASDIGCDGVYFDVYQDWGEFMPDSIPQNDMDQLNSRLRSLRPVMKAHGLKNNVGEVLLRYRLGKKAWKRLPCYVGWFHTRIKVDGTVIPCGASTLSMGNVNSQSLKDIWNSRKYRDFRKKMGSSNRSDADTHEFCDWCCLGKSNYKVHRVAKLILPGYRRNQ